MTILLLHKTDNSCNMSSCLVVWGMLLLAVFVKSGQARPPSQKPESKCRDVHVWIASGAADCSYLEKESSWGIHTNPAYWCDVYKYTECCETCDRLRKNGFKKVNAARTYPHATLTEIKELNVSKKVT